MSVSLQLTYFMRLNVPDRQIVFNLKPMIDKDVCKGQGLEGGLSGLCRTAPFPCLQGREVGGAGGAAESQASLHVLEEGLRQPRRGGHGPIRRHPPLDDLDSGDQKFHTDFRRVYATALDGWLGVDSRAVLGGTYEPVDVLRRQS